MKRLLALLLGALLGLAGAVVVCAAGGGGGREMSTTYNCWRGGDVLDENDRAPSRGMHKANAEKSARLLRTLRAFRVYPEGPTTREVHGVSGSMAPATDISELRANGYLIDCEYEDITFTGRKIFRYYLRGKKENPKT